uniref:Uncharacterized protein n=1 Tax=Cannabis sativa TaxID=3483 RepID=A0A803PQM5_CANSA
MAKAQGFISLKEAYQQAFGVPPAPTSVTLVPASKSFVAALGMLYTPTIYGPSNRSQDYTNPFLWSIVYPLTWSNSSSCSLNISLTLPAPPAPVAVALMAVRPTYPLGLAPPLVDGHVMRT